MQSQEGNEVLDTLNTNNFNSKIYNSVQDQELSAGLGGATGVPPSDGGIFADMGNSKILSVIQTNQSKEAATTSDGSAIKGIAGPIQVLTPGPTLDADLS